MPAIRPDDLPPAASVVPGVALIVDNGTTVQKATPIQVMDAGRPLASQAEAEAGADNVKVVSSLRVKQAIDAQALIPLSSDAGAGLSGFAQDEAYTPGTLGKKGQQDNNPLDAPFNAVGNGSTNDRTALFNTDALGPIAITANHRISSNLTFTKPVRFVGQGRLTIDGGVTVTFAAGVTAPRQQIFYGTGEVAGLETSRLEWFAGDADANPPVIECSARVQLWLDSVVNGGALKSMPMRLLINGTNYLTVTKGQSFVGPGEWQLFLQWSGTATRGFSFPSAPTLPGPNFTGFQFRMNTPGTIPTVGTALKVDNSYTRIENFYIEDCYDGYENTATVATFLNNFQIIGAVNAGHRLNGNVLDHHMDKFIIQALYDWVTLSGVVGTISPGDAITVSTGQTGTIISKYDATHYRVRFVGPQPAAAATITDTTSGATATIAAITSGHQQGGMVILDNAEAVTARAGDVLGGEKGFITFTGGTDPRDGFCFSRIETVYYDSSYEGSTWTGAYGNVLLGTWFASSANSDAQGLVLARCRDITAIAPQFVNNGANGLAILGDCEDIIVFGIKCDGNCALGGLADVFVDAGAQGIQFFGGKAGYEGSSGLTPPKAFYFAAGATNRVTMIGVEVPAGTVVNGATGAVQTWLGIRAVSPRFEQGAFSDFADDAAAAAGGISVGGLYRTASAVKVRVA